MTLYSNFFEQGRKNVLWNGNFDVWPGGDRSAVSLTGATHSAICAVGFKSGAGAYTAEGSNASKPNNDSAYVHKITVTTAESSVDAGDYAGFLIRIEGYDFQAFVGKTATLSFWVRSSVTGTYTVTFRNAARDRTLLKEYTINQADTWEYKTLTLTFDYTGGTWTYTNTNSLDVGWMMLAGSTYQTSTTDSWVSGNYLVSTNQVNAGATIGNTFQVAQCQLELGATASSFEKLPVALLEEVGQRYYFTTDLYLNATQVQTGTANLYASWDFPTHMRTSPTITHPGTNQLWNGTWYNATGLTHSAYTYRCLSIMTRSATGYTVRTACLMLMTEVIADARL
jgi:hypothetical protein